MTSDFPVVGAIAIALVAMVALIVSFFTASSEDPATRREGMRKFASAEGFTFSPEPNYLMQSRFPPHLKLLGDNRLHAINILLREDKAANTECAIFDYDRNVEGNYHRSANLAITGGSWDGDTWTEHVTVFGFRFRGKRLPALAPDTAVPQFFAAWTDEEWLFIRCWRVPVAPKKGMSLADAWQIAQQFRDATFASNA